MINCKICGRECINLNSLGQHVRLFHKMLIYEYQISYDDSRIKCLICGNRKKNSSKKYCDSKVCHIISYKISLYERNFRSRDIFNMFDLNQLICKFDDTAEFIKYYKYIEWFKRYLLKDSYIFLPDIFLKIEVSLNEIDLFLDRIRNQEIDLKLLKLKNNVQSVERWKIMGFDETVSEKISNYFKTTECSFNLKNKDFNIYRKNVSNGRKGKSPITSMTKQYWKNKGFSDKEIKIKMKEKNSRNLDYFIKKYGDELGRSKYNNMILKRKFKFSLKGYVVRYGEEKGIKKYFEVIRKKTINTNIVSKQSVEFISELFKLRKIKYESEVEVGEFICDFCLDNNIILEYYGDWYHGNKWGNINRKDVEILKNHHIFRCKNILSTNYKKLIVVWESSFFRNREETLYKILQFIDDRNISYAEINCDYRNNKLKEIFDYEKSYDFV